MHPESFDALAALAWDRPGAPASALGDCKATPDGIEVAYHRRHASLPNYPEVARTPCLTPVAAGSGIELAWFANRGEKVAGSTEVDGVDVVHDEAIPDVRKLLVAEVEVGLHVHPVVHRFNKVTPQINATKRATTDPSEDSGRAQSPPYVRATASFHRPPVIIRAGGPEPPRTRDESRFRPGRPLGREWPAK